MMTLSPKVEIQTYKEVKNRWIHAWKMDNKSKVKRLMLAAED